MCERVFLERLPGQRKFEKTQENSNLLFLMCSNDNQLCSNDNQVIKCIYYEVTKFYLRKSRCHLYFCIIALWMICFSTGTPANLSRND